jgi:hypothetical protein
MGVYELSKTPQPGIFLRHRSNAISVRARRRKGVDQNDNVVDEPKTPTLGQNRRSSRYSNEFDDKLQAKSEERVNLSENWRRQRAYSNDWDASDKRRKNSYEDEDDEDEEEDDLQPRPVSRRDFERKSEVFCRSRSRTGYRSSGPMETLDRRISASTDNLDTLKREKKSNRTWADPADRSASRGPPTRPRSASSRKEPKSAVDQDFTIRINGEKMSKNRYFFGGELKSAARSKSRLSQKQDKTTAKNVDNKITDKNGRKTAVDIFLEDKGPYSRKLYGPPPSSGKEESEEKHRPKQTRSQEMLFKNQLHQEVSNDDFSHHFGEISCPKDICKHF